VNCFNRIGAVVFAFSLLLPNALAQTADGSSDRSLGDIAREEREKRQAKGRQLTAEQQTIQSQREPEASTIVREVPIDPVKEADIQRLLNLTGAKANIEQGMANMEKTVAPLLVRSFPPGAYRQQLIDLFFAKLRSKTDVQELLNLAVPIYDKYLSDEDIKGLIEFYTSSLGRKAVTALPKAADEMRDQSRKWGEGIGRQAMKEVLAEHPELAKALEEAAKAANLR
jgi:hypothetical protein